MNLKYVEHVFNVQNMLDIMYYFGKCNWKYQFQFLFQIN